MKQPAHRETEGIGRQEKDITQVGGKVGRFKKTKN